MAEKKASVKLQIAKAISTWEENKMNEVLEVLRRERKKASWKLLSKYTKCYDSYEQPTLKKGGVNL